jgi:DNA polymerase zeta
MEVILESKTLPYLPYFDRMGLSPATAGDKPAIVLDKVKEEETYRGSREACTLRNWQISTAPPSASVVRVWAQGEKSSNAKKIETKRSRARLSQIEGPTQKQGAGSNTTDQAVNHRHETQYMSVMSLEVHVNTTGDLAPDPVKDEVACVFWGIDLNSHDVGSSPTRTIGILVLGEPVDSRFCSVGGVQIDVEYEKDELDLLNRMVDIVREFDPDILVGYEVHNGSWGFLIERARIKYEFDLPDEFSRMKSQSHGRFGKEADAWGFTQSSSILITGRHMINIWRSVRGDLNLLQYTLENVAFHVLQKRVPHYGFPDLTSWYRSKDPHRVARVMNYFLSRMQLNIEILRGNEVVSQTSEQARLLGVDFFSVISRGSQFKVESLMFRIAKPENYVLVSPSRKQVGRQNALECLPLVMEPQSRFYTSPLLVFDFQSLYPSVMIAYNYCYSTCLGRVADFHGQNKMGFTDFKRIPGMLELLGDHINIAPNGMMYARPELRKSLLAKMLTEILETRVMVKSGMKQDKDDKVLQLLLNNRQLALKLIANVTYGYTSASFSGRMPCAEIADSIVQTGRETLEKAIALIHSQGKWDAEVVYGDTDSLFVYLKGRSREEAFAIGKDIAETITNANPKPVKLKFEKMYHPCVLLAKKRYVGFKYETLDQREPDFDAKGIETVRRDGTPAEQKIEERALKILFTLQDLTAVKGYFQDQCSKIMSGRVSIQDFLFAKEVRLGTYSEKGPPPPGALVATKKMQDDARKEPQYGERVPYVVIAGAPGSRLIDRCVDPSVLLEDDQVELDADYYINKNLIPPLERIFSLVGANVRSWYDEMPKVQRARAIQILIPALEGAVAEDSLGNIAKKTLENYLRHSTCLVCHSRLFPIPPEQNSDGSGIEYLPICDDCEENPDTSLHLIRRQLQKAETRLHNVREVCRSCSSISFGEDITCDNRDCPVFYTRVREASASRSLKEKAKIVTDAFESDEFSAEFSW